MSSHNAPIADVLPVPQSEAPVLEPNDAVILMLFARYQLKDGPTRNKLLGLLSAEGTLIAQALLGLVDEAKLPSSVLATAAGLRNLVKHIHPVQKPRKKTISVHAADAEIPKGEPTSKEEPETETAGRFSSGALVSV